MIDGPAARVAHLVDLRRFQEADAALRPLLAERPDDVGLLGLLAQVRLGLEDHHGALDAANRLVAAAPDEEWGHRIAAVALSGMGRHDEAVAAATQAVRLDPDDWHTHHVLALAGRNARGQLRLARRAAEEAVRLAPNEASAHFALGLVASEQHDWDLARAGYERTLALDPEHAAAVNNLTLLRGGTNLSRLAHGLSSALRLDPGASAMRQNVDWLAARFVRRLYWASLIALICGLVVTAASTGADAAHVSAGSVALGIVLLVGTVVYTIVLGRSVPLGIRRYVAPRMVREPFLLANVVLTGAMLATALAVCWVPGGTTIGLIALRPLGLANVGLFVWAMSRR